jgi:phosphatidylglycerophosphate synthase
MPAGREEARVRELFVALFTPLARHLRGVSPNALTLVSLLAGAAAGGAFLLAHGGRGYYWLAALLLAVSGAADSLDGIVARMYSLSSPAGSLLDHFGDRLVEVCILGGIAFSPRASALLGLWVLVLTQLHSGLGTQIEASLGARRYDGAGKAEQFVALIAFAIALGCAPELSLALAGNAVSLPNAFLAGLGLATAAALVHRFAGALRRCASSRERG